MAQVDVFTTDRAPCWLLSEIRRLLDTAFSGEFSDDDWEHTLGGLHAVAFDDDLVVAHAAVVERTLAVGERTFRTGYVEGVATLPGREDAGYGSLVVGRVTDEVRRAFEMGALSTDRYSFYERLGWKRWRGPTFVRDGAEVVRTEDEDDGVMVLRFGPSADVDLTSSITCEARTGDDW
ncbi:MAG: GNAT family N-acetyltransferase [Actinomycetota bacterium]|nr:GNAT family N-acetyltransferase [Actinomycetota bacterium]